MRPASLLLPVLWLLGCRPSAAELCRRDVELQCRRQFECQSAEVKASPGFQGGWGISVEACNQQVGQQAGCSSLTSDDQLCVGEFAGKAFDLDNAAKCYNSRALQTCAEYLDPAKLPASCAVQCK